MVVADATLAAAVPFYSAEGAGAGSRELADPPAPRYSASIRPPSRSGPIDDLTTYAALAEIFGAAAIVGGGLFALVQLAEFRRRRRYQVAADLCRGFTEPELARAVTLLRSLPDGLGLADFQKREPKYQEAAQLIAMSFETMGLLVHKDIASFQIVQELTGGLLLMMWRKIGCWARDTRVEQGNPRFAEWVQWLAERIEEQEAGLVPAYQAHRGWRSR